MTAAKIMVQTMHGQCFCCGFANHLLHGSVVPAVQQYSNSAKQQAEHLGRHTT